MRWVVNPTPWLLLLYGNRPCTYHTGGWVGHRAGLDRRRKSRPPPGFDLLDRSSHSELCTGCVISSHTFFIRQWMYHFPAQSPCFPVHLPVSLQAFKGITIQCFWVYVKSDMLPLLSPCQLQIISLFNSSFGGLIRWNSEGSRSGLQAGQSRTSSSVFEGSYCMDSSIRACTLMQQKNPLWHSCCPFCASDWSQSVLKHVVIPWTCYCDSMSALYS